ncbi:uncharacterized protein LOC132716734, partial [Ruditapes philippinarum]|uniref:uncharacterized protein LOC132716734 n=1 Tax=Ruditapes philippinarum TaxID=129788 RepID=UPI00295B638F
MEDLIETDATGVPDRNCDKDIPHYKQDERVECLENVPVILQSIPDPPSDWTLNCLLDDIAMKVDDNKQLERFKALFRGCGKSSIGKGKLEECTSCIQFFNILKERMFISKDNLLYLQKFLYMLDDKELIVKLLDYCRTQNKPYAYKEEFNEAELEEFRCKQVKFHLKGEDHLEKNHQIAVREKIAVILGVPHENVIIIGVERVASLCVTLLIPKTYAAIFQNMLEENQQFEELGALSIDWIYIDNKGYNITGTEDISEAQQQGKIESIYAQYEEKIRCLEKTEAQNLELKENIDVLKQMLDDEKNRTEDISEAQQQGKIESIYAQYEEKIRCLEKTEAQNLELKENIDVLKQMLDDEKNRTEDISEAQQQGKIESIYAQYEEKIRCLEKTEAQNLELKENIDVLKQMLDDEKNRRLELESQD